MIYLTLGGIFGLPLGWGTLSLTVAEWLVIWGLVAAFLVCGALLAVRYWPSAGWRGLTCLLPSVLAGMAGYFFVLALAGQ